jgi:23S rRNA pseudouridine1911/1915/1917 synthase
VSQALDGARLDAALVAVRVNSSRSKLQALIKSGGVMVDGEVVLKPGTPVASGSELCLTLPAGASAPTAADSRRALDVLFEDEHLIAISKPPGLLTHRTERGGENSLAELARALYGDLPSLQGEDRPGIVHRLDRETSGVLVLGRTEEALTELMRQFREREVRKTYQALVHGDPRFDSDWIEEPLGRDPRHPDRVAVVPVAEGGREAQTFYEVQERFGELAFLHATPKTGRTHQIRVHLLSIGAPVIGDRVYRLQRGRTPKLPEGVTLPRRQMLHAFKLELKHPVTGDALCFEAPPPGDFAELLEALRARA